VAEEEKGDVTHHFWKVDRSEARGLTAKLVLPAWTGIRVLPNQAGSGQGRPAVAAQGVRPCRCTVTNPGAAGSGRSTPFPGEADALVATDVVARGIHVDDLPCVVQFDLPPITRITPPLGRTGRAGTNGTVVTLVTDEQRKEIQSVQRAFGMEQGLLAPFSSPTPTLTPDAAADADHIPQHLGEGRPSTMTGTVKFFMAPVVMGSWPAPMATTSFVHHLRSKAMSARVSPKD